MTCQRRGWFGKYSAFDLNLKGEPYRRELPSGEVVDCSQVLETLALISGYHERVKEGVLNRKEILSAYDFHTLDGILKGGENLNFEAAYAAGALIAAGSNKVLQRSLREAGINLPEGVTLLLQAVSLLQVLAAKESLVGLSPEEIAGLTAAVLELDTVLRVGVGEEVFAIGGMGGDKGFGKGLKTFSVSTLASIALAEFGETHKHHSYSNTSKVGGQNAVEIFGARSDFASPKQFERVLSMVNLLMTSCHMIRTVHNISHILKGETVNHIIGPLSIPQKSDDSLILAIGVNHNVHPQTVIEAIKILRDQGIQKYSAAVAFCGLSARDSSEVPREILNPQSYYASRGLRELVRLDEVAPPPYLTLASFLTRQGEVVTRVITPEEFGVEGSNCQGLVENSFEAIVKANQQVLLGEHEPFVNYTAMTPALVLSAKEGGEGVGEYFQQVREVILDGRMNRRFKAYIEATQQVCGISRI